MQPECGTGRRKMPKKDIAGVTQYFQFFMENPIRKRATTKTNKHDSKNKNRTSCQSTSFVLETECVQKKSIKVVKKLVYENTSRGISSFFVVTECPRKNILWINFPRQQL